MNCHLGSRIRLIYVVEAAEVHTTDVKATNTDGSGVERLKLNSHACLDSIRILVILNKSHNRGVSEKAALGQCSFTWETNVRKWDSIRVGACGQELIEPQSCDSGATGKSKKPRIGIERVLERPPRIFSERSAA